MESVYLPLWMVVAGAFVLWVALDRLLIRGACWLPRRRAVRTINELNARLKLRISAFHPTEKRPR